MPKKESFIETLQKLRARDIVYPGIFSAFLVVVIIVFYLTVHSISGNIDKVLSNQTASGTQALNLESYQRIAKKLNIPVTIPDENAPLSEEVAVDADVAVVATSTTPKDLDKTVLKIVVANSTGKTGLATGLAKHLVAQGFKDPKTANESTRYSTTTIKIKKGYEDYAGTLLEAVSPLYPHATTTVVETLTEDVRIIIGTH